eukprot:3323733-Pyramimonas_sp.AAC.1
MEHGMRPYYPDRCKLRRRRMSYLRGGAPGLACVPPSPYLGQRTPLDDWSTCAGAEACCYPTGRPFWPPSYRISPSKPAPNKK